MSLSHLDQRLKKKQSFEAWFPIVHLKHSFQSLVPTWSPLCMNGFNLLMVVLRLHRDPPNNARKKYFWESRRNPLLRSIHILSLFCMNGCNPPTAARCRRGNYQGSTGQRARKLLWPLSHHPHHLHRNHRLLGEDKHFLPNPLADLIFVIFPHKCTFGLNFFPTWMRV